MLGKLLREIVPARLRPIRHLELLAWNGSQRQIRSGPFQGVRYGLGAVGSALIPKFLGIYERELHPVIERAIAARVDLVIDIGAAEGYYAVGLASRLPTARVIAYEMDPAGQTALRDMARQNGVADRLEVRGACTQHALRADLDGLRAIVVCDCEGAERELLDPVRVPGLSAAAVLVELHDFIVPGIGEEIMARFASTHTIERVWQTERRRAEFPYANWYTRLLPGRYLDWAVSEWRPVRMSWLWMTPSANHS